MGFGVEGFSTFGVVGGRFLNFFKDFASYEVVRAYQVSKGWRTTTNGGRHIWRLDGQQWKSIEKELTPYVSKLKIFISNNEFEFFKNPTTFFLQG